ncbi:MAG: 4-hydroxy-tetrahydrodipicolinate synthase [Verrucomicrobia bacterium]|nr:4-hydroxy-tetrahydrodipicolinate synthase [Verrucomicrobiota bacterium]
MPLPRGNPRKNAAADDLSMSKTLAEIRHALSGPIASLSVPFTRTGQIDFAGLRNFIDFVIAGGSRTILLTYGDSLYSLLTDEEVATVTKATVDHTARRALVVAADRMWWTGKTVEFSAFCRDAGADMLMVLPPDWCQSCTVDTLVDHYRQVARQIPVMVVTNFLLKWPLSRTLELLRRLRDEVPGILAVKDDVCGELGRHLGLEVHDRWAVFASGTKQIVLNNVPFGCDGYLSSFIYIKPEIAHAFWAAAKGRNDAAIRKIIAEVDIPFWEFMVSTPGSFDAVVHGIMEAKGLAQRWRRSPYYSLNDEEMNRVSAFLKGKGWL